MKTAYLFAGQGAQHPGMGQDLYEKSEAFRRVFDQAAGAVDFDLKEVCFADAEGRINRTRYTQPCMMAFAMGMLALLRDRGDKPDLAAGLSLGEYGALAAAGVLDPIEAVKMVAFRGKVMEDAAKGLDCGMTAVLGLEEEKLSACCREAEKLGVVSICNYNCPGQLVISGEKPAVDEAGRLAKEAGAKRCMPLTVSGPFHTALMKPAGDALAEYFRHVDWKPAGIPVLFNCLGEENRDNIPISELLVRQVQTGVKMEAIIRRLFALGTDRFVEIGPGKTLAGFVKKTAKDMDLPADSWRVVSLETIEDVEKEFG